MQKKRSRPERAQKVLLVLILLLFASSSYAQRLIHVDAAATGANDGTSWADAFTSLQDAFEVAGAGDEIWVAAGTYRPDQGQGVTAGDRTASFHLRPGVALYGGFKGGETSLEQRDVAEHVTVLSGDLAGDDAEACRWRSRRGLRTAFTW